MKKLLFFWDQNRPRFRHPIGALRLSESGIVFADGSVCSERIELSPETSRELLFKAAAGHFEFSFRIRKNAGSDPKNAVPSFFRGKQH